MGTHVKEKTTYYIFLIVSIVAVVGLGTLVLEKIPFWSLKNIVGQASATCSDTDGGMTYTVRGTVSGGTWKTTERSYSRKTDYCKNSTDIYEYYCSDATHAFFTTKSCERIVGAGNICYQGACALDSDNDGVSDASDVCVGYDDNDDVDSDGIPDGCDDSDSEGLTDYEEVVIYGTNPLDADTDDDGFNDYDEVIYGADPTDATDYPLFDTDGDGVLDINDVCPDYDDAVDTDGDGIPAGCDTSTYSYELCNNNLYHGWNISYCEGSPVTGTDFSLFSNGIYVDNNGSSYTYTQTLEFQNQQTGQFIFTQDDDDAPIAEAYLFIDNGNAWLYDYSLLFDTLVLYDSSSEAATESDLVGTTLEIQGVLFTITDVNLSTTGAINELTLEDSWGITRVLRNNDEIMENDIDVDGSLSLIYSTAGELSGLSIGYAPDTDEVYLTEISYETMWGWLEQAIVDPLFEQFKINFTGIENDDYETIEFIARSTSAEIHFTNNDGTIVELPLAADSSYTAGEYSTEPIFWGLEAPSSTTANQDELLYLEEESCQGGSSVVDCQGAMFLVIDASQNAHLIQITNVDVYDNEMNFDDITYGASNDNMPYADGTVSDISLTSVGDIQILVDESTMTVTFTSIGSNDDAQILTFNNGILGVINKDASLQTFQGLRFYEYNDGTFNTNKYLGYTSLGSLNITASFDDRTDNSIEWNSSAVSSLTSREGRGLFDESDEDDDYQKFMTWKGTILSYDREDQLNLTIEHPSQPIYAIIKLESME